MNEGVKRQHARIAAEKRIEEIEAGDRYSCAEKYELGACTISSGPSSQAEQQADIAREMPRFEAPEKFGPGMIETYTGDTYYFDNPDPTHIHLADIAHALSNHCRYAGHTRRFYSVGEHSLLVRDILKAQGYDRFIQLCGLFHDAHEAYVMDAPRPLKPLLGKAFVEVADKADGAIAEWFGEQGIMMFPGFFHASNVKRADNMALVYERKQLMTAPPERWESGFEDVPDLPAPLNNRMLGQFMPTITESKFLSAAHELGVSE